MNNVPDNVPNSNAGPQKMSRPMCGPAIYKGSFGLEAGCTCIKTAP